MFGDFSRFSNDPELGLTGVYLSQGSALLDSDWNEQVAALTDWITALGRLAGGETLRRIDLEAALGDDGKLVVNPGMALLAGKCVTSSRRIEASWENRYSGTGRVIHLFNGAGAPTSATAKCFLVAMAQSKPRSSLETSPSEKSLAGGATWDMVDWRICVSNQFDSLAQPAPGGHDNLHIHTNEPIPQSKARSYGDGRSGVPQVKISGSDHEFWRTMRSTLVALIECHSSHGNTHQFKVARSPSNVLVPGDWKVDTPIDRGKSISYAGGECPFLDLGGEGREDVWAEYVDDDQAFASSLMLLKDPDAGSNRDLFPYSALFRIRIDPTQRSVRLIDVPEHGLPSTPGPGARLRFWNALIGDSNQSFPLLEKSTVRAVVMPHVGANAQRLFPGDCWYLPIHDGQPASGNQVLYGHRVFRAIGCMERDFVQIASVDPASQPERFAQNVSLPDEPPPPARRNGLDDSLYRLTSALNATRMLTRNTPCKELQTRVSFLPLRRWLASAYVHEIADLDLDTFLAKVQRSIDVPLEEEHRFRDQASLVLEEARRIGGGLEFETASPIRWA